MGIIPARAGFTVLSFGIAASVSGSSPLARGLLEWCYNEFNPSGIIPARAGFTGMSPFSFGSRTDHPRSRGVYCVRKRRPPTISGSSPLARGLHSGGSNTVAPVRIIPARAGFTYCESVVGAVPEDHPRSRGVYAPEFVLAFLVSGSSPLARGLLGLLSGCAADRRIIPARAGFTRHNPSRR